MLDITMVCKPPKGHSTYMIYSIFLVWNFMGGRLGGKKVSKRLLAWEVISRKYKKFEKQWYEPSYLWFEDIKMVYIELIDQAKGKTWLSW